MIFLIFMSYISISLQSCEAEINLVARDIENFFMKGETVCYKFKNSNNIRCSKISELKENPR